MGFINDIFGGGSDTTTTTVNYPPWMEDLIKARAELARYAGSIGPMMYTGPSVAAQTPQTLAAIANTNELARNFGLATAAPGAGLPPPQDFGGGVVGYSGYPMVQQAYGALPEWQRDMYMSLYGPGGLLDPTAEPIDHQAPDVQSMFHSYGDFAYGGSNSGGYDGWGDTHGIDLGAYNESDPGEMAEDW